MTANAAMSTYGASPPTLTAMLSGFVNGDTSSVVSGAPSLSITATAASGVGTYPITVGAGTLAATNYDFPDLVNGTLTIAKAHLTVTANAATGTYGASSPPLTATVTGFVNGDTSSVVSGAASLSTAATAASGAGTYPITVGVGTLSAANYDFPNLVNGTLTITKAHLTVTANAATSTEGITTANAPHGGAQRFRQRRHVECGQRTCAQPEHLRDRIERRGHLSDHHRRSRDPRRRAVKLRLPEPGRWRCSRSAPGVATLDLSSVWNLTYDGATHTATVDTDPAGLMGVTVTYTKDNESVTAPTGAGSYAVTATLNDPNFSAAAATGTLVINPAAPTIAWATPADISRRHAAAGRSARRRILRTGRIQLQPTCGHHPERRGGTGPIRDLRTGRHGELHRGHRHDVGERGRSYTQSYTYTYDLHPHPQSQPLPRRRPHPQLRKSWELQGSSTPGRASPRSPSHSTRR